MEANLNQFRLLTVEGEQFANEQRRSHREEGVKSQKEKHRLVYEDCPFFCSTKDVTLRKTSSERLSMSNQAHVSYEPAVCDHPRHHNRRHRQLCRHVYPVTTFQNKRRRISQSHRQLSTERNGENDDDNRYSKLSLPQSEENDNFQFDFCLRKNKEKQDMNASLLGLEEMAVTLAIQKANVNIETDETREQNFINTIKSLEKTMALHCQLLIKRLGRERSSFQFRTSHDIRHRLSQSLFSQVTPKTNVRLDKVIVFMRVIFLKIGEIDTMKENFVADALIQARWREPALDGFREQLTSNSEDVDWHKYWNPKLYVENNLGEPKETIWQMLSFNPKGEAVIYERRRIKGCFLENLELDDFPFDTQELTLTITSERADTELELNEDNIEISSINVQSFVDEQEWELHSHVETWKCITTKIFQNSKLKHPSFSTSCRASRRAGFYIWNIFLVMVFICSLTFATFSVELTKPENRLQLSFILLLTTITFKFVVSQTLPRISYLTYLDKYILTSMGILCGVCVWHAIIPLFKDEPEIAKFADKWGLVVFSSCYFLFHLFFFLYIYIMALKRRWKYDQKDKEHKDRVRKLQQAQEHIDAEQINQRIFRTFTNNVK